MSTILQIAHADRNLSLFCKALRYSGLDSRLTGDCQYTILVPVNLALGTFKSLMDEQKSEHNRNKIFTFLAGYILLGKKMLWELKQNQLYTALNGKLISITSSKEVVYINGARIVSSDLVGTNGVIHLLDNVYNGEVRY